MAKQIHLLDTSADVPSGAYILLNKVVGSSNLDYKIDLGTLLSPYVNRNTEVGNAVGKIPVLIDIGGNPALPALDGSQLTNINLVSGTGAIEGGVRLSDSVSSTSGVNDGFAATPKAVRDLGLTKLSTTGGVLTGNLTFANDLGVIIRNFNGDSIKLFELTIADVLNIGAFGAVAVNTVNLAAGTTFNIQNTAGVTKFSFNTSTGAITGFKASDITTTATSTTLAGTVQTALTELASEKLDKTGGTVTGNITFNNNIRLNLGAFPIFYDSAATTLRLGTTGAVPSTTALQTGLVSFRNTAGTQVFSFNTATGVATGFKASDIAFTATGTISSTNVQAAIAELGTEKLATGAQAYDSARLGGVLASAFQTTAQADAKYLQTGSTTVYDSERLGGVLASEFRTKTQNDALYLGLLGTANNSSKLGNVAAASFQTTAQADAKYLLAGGTAYDSSRLGSVLASDYLTRTEGDSRYVSSVGSTVDNALNLGGISAANYLTEAEAVANYLGKTATAANSNQLGGVAASGYVTTTGTAYNASRLGNTLASAYQTTAQADAKYLLVGGTAANSSSLGGVAASTYARKDQANTFTSTVTVNGQTTLDTLKLLDSKSIIFGAGSDAYLRYIETTGVLELMLGTAAGTDTNSFKITSQGVDRFTFTKASGDFTATGNITGTSDIRVKENIKSITGALAGVRAIGGKTFDRTDVACNRQMGVIAQEAQKHFPEAVIEDAEGRLSVAYGNLAAGAGFAAIDELATIVETQATEIAELKVMVQALLEK